MPLPQLGTVSSAVESSLQFIQYTKTEALAPQSRVNAISFVAATMTIRLPWASNSQGMFMVYGLIGYNVSKHIDKFAVTSFGRPTMKGFTYGNTVVAGSFIFNTLEESPFAPIIAAYCNWAGKLDMNQFVGPEEIPPFDVDIIFYSEDDLFSGTTSHYIKLRSVSIIDYTNNITIDQVKGVESFSFIAESFTNLTASLTSNNVVTTPAQPSISGAGWPAVASAKNPNNYIA